MKAIKQLLHMPITPIPITHVILPDQSKKGNQMSDLITLSLELWEICIRSCRVFDEVVQPQMWKLCCDIKVMIQFVYLFLQIIHIDSSCVGQHAVITQQIQDNATHVHCNTQVHHMQGINV